MGSELLFLLALVNVAEWSHVDALEFAFHQIASQVPEYIIRFLRF